MHSNIQKCLHRKRWLFGHILQSIEVNLWEKCSLILFSISHPYHTEICSVSGDTRAQSEAQVTCCFSHSRKLPCYLLLHLIFWGQSDKEYQVFGYPINQNFWSPFKRWLCRNHINIFVYSCWPVTMASIHFESSVVFTTPSAVCKSVRAQCDCLLKASK